MPARLAQFFTTYQITFCVIPSSQSVPFLRMERNALPLTTRALWVHASIAALTHAGTGSPHVPSFADLVYDNKRFPRDDLTKCSCRVAALHPPLSHEFRQPFPPFECEATSFACTCLQTRPASCTRLCALHGSPVALVTQLCEFLFNPCFLYFHKFNQSVIYHQRSPFEDSVSHWSHSQHLIRR